MAQCIAFFDNVSNKIVADHVVREICSDLGTYATDLDMTPLYRGGGDKRVIARECDKCGAPMGNLDPDECLFVMLGVCFSCGRE